MITLTFKNPDVIHNAMSDYREQLVDVGLSQEEIEEKTNELKDLLHSKLKYGEYLYVRCDPATKELSIAQ